MPKLQEITRKNETKVRSVNIPNEVIEETNWKKGDRLVVIHEKIGVVHKIIIIKEEEEFYGHNR